MIGLKYNDNTNYGFFLFIDLLKKILRGCLYFRKYKSKHFVAIGKNVKVLGRKKNLVIGKNVKIEDGVFLQSVSENGILLGDNVTICQNSIIRPSGFYGGKLGWGLVMGHHSSIGAASYIGCSGKIEIGNNVMIGPHCTMIAENHNYTDNSMDMIKQGVTNLGIQVKDNVWIGANVTILDGVVIETGCILAAGAVVTKSTEPNGIYAGIPAKKVKDRI